MKKKDYIKIQKIINNTLGKNKEITNKIEFIHGLISAILCAPEIIPPSVWLSALLSHADGTEIEFDSKENAQELIGSLMGLYNEIAQSLVNGEFNPLYSHMKEPGLNQLRQDPETAKVWCKGFVNGLALWRTNFVYDEKARKFIGPILLLLDKDDNFLEEDPNLTPEVLTKLRKDFVLIVGISVTHLRDYYMQKPKAANHIGRNHLCPCGSGKKYKKCCGVY